MIYRSPNVLRVRSLIAIAWIAVATTSGQALAQVETNVPQEAKELIVRVTSTFNGARDIGAGIIFGVDTRSIYVATARHLVERRAKADTILVGFWSPDSGQGLSLSGELWKSDSLLDLAVIRVRASYDSTTALWERRSFTRLGTVGRLKSNEAVSPVGCPQGECWGAPAKGSDRVMNINSLDIEFSSFFVGPGSSGGGLFNTDWELVGMVVQDQPPRAIARPIDLVSRQMKAWGLPARLRKPSVPRAGYRITIGGAIMAPAARIDEPFADDRVPSGRITVSRAAQRRVSWHVGAIRLAPANVNIGAGAIGLGLNLKAGRFVLHPFVEGAFGRVKTRFDIGGYFVDDGGGSTYVPVWDEAVEDRIGGGLGASLEINVLPRTILELVGGYWGFPTPEMEGIDETFVKAPQVSNFFVGAGVRFGV